MGAAWGRERGLFAFQAASAARVPGLGHQHHVTGGCPRTPSLAVWQSMMGTQHRPSRGSAQQAWFVLGRLEQRPSGPSAPIL